MSRVLRRLLSRIDSMVSRVENHEALVARALADERDKRTRVERERSRVSRHAALLERAWRSAIDEQHGWLERARREPDEKLALECLKQGKRAGARAAELNEQCHQQAELSRRLEALSVRLTERLRGLEEQHELMQNREAHAVLAHTEERAHEGSDHDVTALLRRWEASVEELNRRVDPLDDEPELEDDEVFLKLELDELRRESQ